MKSTILLGSSDKTLLHLQDNSIDLVVTSPPYKEEDGYNEVLIERVFKETYRLQRNNTLLFVNFGHLAKDKLRPFRVAEIISKCGYKLQETIVWVKNHYTPLQGNRLNNLTEFIFMFSKSKMPKIDRLAIGVPYADKSNIGRYSNSDLKCGGNVWYINYETIQHKKQKKHKDRYPLELPARCIKLCGYTVENILDPFMGSGTTLVAALKAGVNGIGSEIDHGIAMTAMNELVNIGGEVDIFTLDT